MNVNPRAALDSMSVATLAGICQQDVIFPVRTYRFTGVRGLVASPRPLFLDDAFNTSLVPRRSLPELLLSYDVIAHVEEVKTRKHGVPRLEWTKCLVRASLL